MRLHRLELTAFGPYPRPETVDFDELGADGLFLLLRARHTFARDQDRAAPAGGASDWLFYAALTVKLGISTGLVNVEPSRYQAGPSVRARPRSDM